MVAAEKLTLPELDPITPCVSPVCYHKANAHGDVLVINHFSLQGVRNI
jgi:hypothetical protein